MECERITQLADINKMRITAGCIWLELTTGSWLNLDQVVLVTDSLEDQSLVLLHSNGAHSVFTDETDKASILQALKDCKVNGKR